MGHLVFALVIAFVNSIWLNHVIDSAIAVGTPPNSLLLGVIIGIYLIAGNHLEKFFQRNRSNDN